MARALDLAQAAPVAVPSGRDTRAMTGPTPPPPPRLRHVVGIGVSAGGLQPLIDLLRGGPLGQGLACVVVQHMAPQQHSALTPLLAARVPWRVVPAEDGQTIEADHVYVIQPGERIAVQDGQLRVTTATHEGGPTTVDHLLCSLAREAGSGAVGIVLSGMGSDGSKGLHAVAEAGGLALAQLPESAQFDAMPRHAAAAAGPGVIVAEPASMMRRVLEALASRADAPAGPLPAWRGAGHDPLAAVLARVAEVTGHDFSLYKPSTLMRRLERRMAIHGATTIDEYVQALAANPQEAQLLFHEMLIGVTAWFRDPPVWEALGAQSLPALCARAAARPEPRLRAWVVGCSTGEEAYSLAIACREVIDADPALAGLVVQIFATDLDPDAIDVARRGLYPAASAEALSAQRRERYFEREGDTWRVVPDVREMVLFARHDVVSDPPFSRLDLVSCRNLLIYFRAVLQQKVLGLFRYVLQPEGLLVLGSSETLGRAEALFEPLDAKLRIYRRGAVPLTGAVAVFPIRTPARAEHGPKEDPLPEENRSETASLQALVERLMLDEFAPSAVLVDGNGDILYLSGQTAPFLEPAAGRANWNVHAMARGGLRAVVSQALQEATVRGHAVDARAFLETDPARPLHVDLAVRPVRALRPGALPELFLLVFRAVPVPLESPAAGRRRRRHPLEAELLNAREEVQALREEMRASQEELQSTNEELQSTNEELQSANEELTTSKEEMQAMNEELQTVNGELVSKLDDLALAQSDLQNLFNSTQIATLFLDGEGNVRRFTEQTKKLFSLRDSDVGRPLTDLTTTLEYAAMADDIRTVLRTLEFRERAVRTSDGRWYSVRIMPYRTQQHVIDGSVITFVDITAAKALEAQLRETPMDRPKS